MNYLNIQNINELFKYVFIFYLTLLLLHVKWWLYSTNKFISKAELNKTHQNTFQIFSALNPMNLYIKVREAKYNTYHILKILV